MDEYHPDKVFSSIDHMGRYAYGNQPSIAMWNLKGLAEALLPAIAADPEEAVEPATEILQTFPARFQGHYDRGIRRKLGLADVQPGDLELARDLLGAMADNGADFTLTFRGLSELADEPTEVDRRVAALFREPAFFDRWAARWRVRLGSETRSESERRADMRSVNPGFIPRNHRVEEAIAAAREADFEPFEALLGVLTAPYDDQPGREAYAAPPRPEEVVHQTFCGT